METGNKNTDYSPSPEDNQSQIDGINNNLSNNYYQKTVVDSKLSTTVDGITAQYTQDITTRLGNYYDKSTIDSKLTIDGQGIASYVKSTQSKLDNLQVGGTNLIKNTSNKLQHLERPNWHIFVSNNNPNTFNLADYLGKRLTLRIWIEKPSVDAKLQLYFNRPNWRAGNVIKAGQSGYSQLTVDVPTTLPTSWNIALGGGNGVAFSLDYKELKAEIGDFATSWSPHPEDMATLTQYTEVKQLADQLSATVYDSTSGLVTKTTQLAGKYAIQNLNSYGDVLASLNLNGGNVRIKGGLIDLDGNVRIQDAFVTNLKANSILANEITAKATTVVNAKIANLDAGVITTGILKGTNLSLNLGTGEVQFQKGRIQAPNNTLDIQVNTGIMKVLNTNGEGVTFQNGNLYFSNASVQGYYGSLLYNSSIDGTVNGVRINGLGGVVLASKSQTGLILNGSFSDIKNGASLNLIEHSDGKGYAFLLSQNSIKIAVNKKRESMFGYAFTGINIYKETDTIDLTAGTTQINGDIMNLSGNILNLNHKEIYSLADKVTFNKVVNFSGNVNFSQKVNNNYLALCKSSELIFDVKGGLSSAYLEVTQGLFTYKIPLQS